MIKKTLLFSLILLIGWSYYLKMKPISVSQNQWQDNIVSAERYLFDIDTLDNLIVGTSLALRIRMDSLPNFYNLSFGGQSIFDGLLILRNKKRVPKNVFIEINLITGGENHNFKKVMSSSILNTLKRNITVFRTDKQPLAYIGRGFVFPIVNSFFYKRVHSLKDTLKNKNIENNSKNSIFDKMLDLHKETYSKHIDSIYMDQQFKKLKSHVDFLESKEVRVVFFEMPVNPELIELSRAKYLRNRVINDYPKNHFIKLPIDTNIYKTSDGMHLTRKEARIYTSYFKKEVLNIKSKDEK